MSATANISLWGNWASCFCHFSHSKPYVAGANLMTLVWQEETMKIELCIPPNTEGKVYTGKKWVPIKVEGCIDWKENR